MEGSTTAYLLLGGNLGDVQQTFQRALELIEQQHSVINQSSLYRSEPWGFEAENTFLNRALEMRTSFTAEELLAFTREIERKLGREQENTNGYTSRVLDIDILFFGNETLKTNQLEIPHPRLHLRNFTLAPLVEIAPELTHPRIGLKIKDLYENCTDRNRVWRI